MLTSPSVRRPAVLTVEDDASISSMLGVALGFLGFDVVAASTGNQALTSASLSPPDVVLLDVVLPDVDGFEVCRRLREAGIDAPVLFLSARDAAEDKVHGLSLGDDYVTKPFDLNEVVARIHALLRRSQPSQPPRGRLRAGWVELDRSTHEVWRHGQQVQLSTTEFALLQHLMQNAGKVTSKAEILDTVWQYGFNGESGIVETYVYYLRRKLGDTDQSLIRTVRGVGYLIRGAGAEIPAED
ncbi:response regulator transcription factor [Streptomyces sp. NBC_00988]|uniref:response regulator transcription factor n=1 Tax=Streptomyces sp. NBC_00988 TaxID=2903704 RepID=UPI003864D8A7|nr:response regulator transcription factor [Streptomyces sp. NBC_00988]